MPNEPFRHQDRYHVLAPLGEGAVGRVERVFDSRLGRIVARKTLRAELAHDEAARRAFVTEARVLGHLDHASIIPIFDAFLSEEGLPVYTMREIRGRSLARVLRMRLADGAVTPLALGRTLKIVTRLAEALAHAHERGVVHLDLKPQNVVVLAHDEVVLVDWGSARVYAPERHAGRLDGHPDLQALSRLPEEDDSLLIGTPRYMSPEQTEQPRSSLGPASDVFSLGALFYQMLTGRAPFEGESLEELLFHIRETEPASPIELDPGIHPRLASIVMRMLAKAPGDRMPSLAAMLRELEAFRSTAAEFPIETFAAGARIFSEGDEGRAAYVIVSGEVEISTGPDAERRVLTRNVEGEVFGELALLGDLPRTADATALTETELRVIDRAALSTEVDRLSPWVRAILSGLVERFVDRSERLVELLRDQH